MAKKTENMDQLFRDKLENHQVKPSKLAWERLENQLPQSKTKLSTYWWAAAAAILLLFTVGSLFWPAQNPLEEEILAEKVESSSNEEETTNQFPVEIETTENPIEIIEEKESAKIDKSPKREAQPKKKNNSSYQKQLEPNKQLIAQNETAPEREAIIEKPITEPLKGLEADIPQIKPLDLNATVAELQPTTEEAPAYKVTIVSNGIKEDKNLISGIGKLVDQVEGILGKVDEGFATLQDAKNSLFTSLTSKKEKVTEKP
ncbi:MAG TPA: hypothetical protein DCS64_01635 [Algoriphagus sp.]|uniref:hypothetical protein n=1 Tax=Algoriphagus sp. TaxID=1872435 RepID=UPI000E8ED732|nr:hypothetical protein [Algoriphagus sp.]HAS57204.1 hypothetical protein [Algoriphagus sp.]